MTRLIRAEPVKHLFHLLVSRVRRLKVGAPQPMIFPWTDHLTRPKHLPKRMESLSDYSLTPLLVHSASYRDQIPMALSRNRKRQRDEDNSHIRPPLKKCKTNVLHRPPEVYDQLSRVWLTRDALEEHNRRNALQPAAVPTIEPSSTRSAKLRALKKLGVAPSACCAVNGGPDLRDLRGVRPFRRVVDTWRLTMCSIPGQQVP